MVFRWSLSDSKSPLVFEILLSILVRSQQLYDQDGLDSSNEFPFLKSFF